MPFVPVQAPVGRRLNRDCAVGAATRMGTKVVAEFIRAPLGGAHIAAAEEPKDGYARIFGNVPALDSAVSAITAASAVERRGLWSRRRVSKWLEPTAS